MNNENLITFLSYTNPLNLLKIFKGKSVDKSMQRRPAIQYLAKYNIKCYRTVGDKTNFSYRTTLFEKSKRSS